MEQQFSIQENGSMKVFSCDKYSCLVRTDEDKKRLSSISINDDVDELYIPDGVTEFDPMFEIEKRDCSVSRIILPASIKEVNCSSFFKSSLCSYSKDGNAYQRNYLTVNEIKIPSFSVIFNEGDMLDWDGPIVICNKSGFEVPLLYLLDLIEQYPEAFAVNEQGNCFFDSGWTTHTGECRLLDKDSVIFIGKAPMPINKSLKILESVTPSGKKASEMVEQKEYKTIACYFTAPCVPRHICFPKTLQFVGFFYKERKDIQFTCFDFAGNLPSFSKQIDWNGDYNNWDVKLEVLRINVPVAEASIPVLLKKMLEKAIPEENGRYKTDGKTIYAAPALCEEESSVPGYINVTACARDKCRLVNNVSGKDNDIVVSINSRYIGSVEPLEIETYAPCVGSLIHIVTTGIEKHYSYIVYEPMEMVMKKISQTRERLDFESLIDKIREVLPKEIRE